MDAIAARPPPQATAAALPTCKVGTIYMRLSAASKAHFQAHARARIVAKRPIGLDLAFGYNSDDENEGGNDSRGRQCFKQMLAEFQPISDDDMCF